MNAGSEGPTLAVQPNPLRDRAEVRLLLPRAMRVEVSIFDLTGRRVFLCTSAECPAGVSVFDWAARDERGHRVPAGLYWVRAEAGGRSTSRRMLVLR